MTAAAVHHAPIMPRLPSRARGSDPATRVWTALALGVTASLALPAVKIPVGIDLRVGQIVLAGMFGLIVLHDLTTLRMRWGPLLAIVGVGLMLGTLSTLTTYPKVKEMTFIIKYVAVFPVAYYVGVRMLPLVGARRLALVLELTLVFALALSVALEAHPVPFLIHERPPHLSVGLKGSFWEQGELAFFAGLFMLGSLALRMETLQWPARRWPLVAVYAFTIGCALASHNKTVWVALVAACLIAAVAYRGRPELSGVARRWAVRLAAAAVLGAIALAAYNAWLPADEKLVTARMLEHKWEAERGAALRIAWEMIMEAPWLGHGFGFVEAYFGNFPSDIIGLGSGVAQLFNSYLDIWLSAGMPGLIYALGLLAVGFSPRSLFSVLTIGYLFTFANVNPVAQHEYYHLFAGLAFAAASQARHTLSEHGGQGVRHGIYGTSGA